MAVKRGNPPDSRARGRLPVRLRTRACPQADIDRKPRSAVPKDMG